MQEGFQQMNLEVVVPVLDWDETSYGRGSFSALEDGQMPTLFDLKHEMTLSGTREN